MALLEWPVFALLGAPDNASGPSARRIVSAAAANRIPFRAACVNRSAACRLVRMLLTTASTMMANPTVSLCALPDNIPATGREQSHERGLAAAVDTCSLPAQVRPVGPRACPVCGMALEPAVTTAKPSPRAELADPARRFWTGSTVPIAGFNLGTGGHLLNIDDLVAPQTLRSVWLLPATAVTLWLGWTMPERDWKSLDGSRPATVAIMDAANPTPPRHSARFRRRQVSPNTIV